MEYWTLNIVNIDYWTLGVHWWWFERGPRQPAVTITRPPAIPIVVSLHHAADFHTFAFRALHSIDAQWHTVGGWGVYVAAVQLIHMTVQIVFVGWCKVYLSDSWNCNCRILQIVFPLGFAQYVECWSCIAPSKSTLHHVGDEWMWLFIQGVELVGPLFRDFRETFFKLKWGGEEEFLDKETFHILKRLSSRFGIPSEQV